MSTAREKIDGLDTLLYVPEAPDFAWLLKFQTTMQPMRAYVKEETEERLNAGLAQYAWEVALPALAGFPFIETQFCKPSTKFAVPPHITDALLVVTGSTWARKDLPPYATTLPSAKDAIILTPTLKIYPAEPKPGITYLAVQATLTDEKCKESYHLLEVVHAVLATIKGSVITTERSTKYRPSELIIAPLSRAHEAFEIIQASLNPVMQQKDALNDAYVRMTSGNPSKSGVYPELIKRIADGVREQIYKQ